MPRGTGADPRITVIIAAGGEATRLPGKLDMLLDGTPLLLRVRRALGSVGTCVVATKKEFPAALAAELDARVVLDSQPGQGPLAALADAVATVETPYFFAAAGDMPGLDAPFVKRIVDAAAVASWPDAVVPAWPDGTLEPLAALYATTPWLAFARAALHAGRRNVTAALEGLHVVQYRVTPRDWEALTNINTPEDFRRALSRFAPESR